tara:strand:- start:173 stop:6271 length:6099 start_codon:yes stop_codon:yes gene_type:complete
MTYRIGGGAYRPLITATGTHTSTYVSDGTQGNIHVKADGVVDITIDSISVREVVGIGPELVTNGTFATGITGWTDNSTGTGSRQWDGVGQLELLNPPGTPANEGAAYQALTVESGKPYQLNATRSGGNSYFQVGTTINSGSIFQEGPNAYDIDTVIIPTTTTIYITIRNYNDATPVLIDNVSVTEVGGTTNGFGFNGDITDGSMGPDAVTDGGFNTGYGFEAVTNGDFATTLGSELVTNGDFATDTNWTGTGSNGWSIDTASQQLDAVSVTANSYVYQGLSVVSGKVYEVVVDATLTSGACSVRGFNTTTVIDINISGRNTYTALFSETDTNPNVGFVAGTSGFTGSIHSVSVKEVIETDWSHTSGAVIYDGSCNLTSDGSFEYILQPGHTATQGKVIEISINITDVTSGSIDVGINGGTYSPFSTVGTHTFRMINDGTIGQLLIRRTFGAPCDITFDNVSLREVIGVGPELVTNGTFGYGIKGWTDASELTGSIAWDPSGKIKLTTPIASFDEGKAYQEITVVIGKTYRVQMDRTGGGSWVNLGDSLFSLSYYQVQGTSTINTVIVATSTSLFVTLRNFNSTATPALIDNVSVTEVLDAEWEQADGTSMAGGVCRINTTGAWTYAQQTNAAYTATQGKVVEVTLDITAIGATNAGQIKASFAGGVNQKIFPTSIGTHSVTLVNNGTTGTFSLGRVSGGQITDITFDNVSVREVTTSGSELIINGDFGASTVLGPDLVTDGDFTTGRGFDTVTNGEMANTLGSDLVTDGTFDAGYGFEAVTNGSFATDTDWTKSGGATVSGGNANLVAGAVITQAETTYAALAGKVIEVTVVITALSGLVRTRVANGTHRPWITTVGTHTDSFVCDGTLGLLTLQQSTFGGAGTGFATIASISVREVFGTGPELVTNGDFVSSISGWTDTSVSPGTVTWDSSGSLSLNNPSASWSTVARVHQELTVVVGKTYRVQATKSGVGSRLTLGDSQWSNSYTGFPPNATVDVNLLVTTSATSLWVMLLHADSAAGAAIVDNVSVTEVLDAKWTQNGGTTSMGDGVCQMVTAGGQGSLLQDGYISTQGKVVEISIDITAAGAGTGALRVLFHGGTTYTSLPTTVGTHTVAVVNDGTTGYLFIYPTGATDITFDNFSVKEVIETAWTRYYNAIIYDGVCRVEGNSGNILIQQAGQGIALGAVSELSIDITNVTAGQLKLTTNGTLNQQVSIPASVGTHTVYFSNNGPGVSIYIGRATEGVATDISFTNVTVREVVGYGPELVTNGDFASPITGWASNNGNSTLTRVGDTAEFANQVDWSYMRYPMTIDSSKTYRVSFDVSAISGSLHIGLGANGNTVTASGSYTYVYSSSATTYDFQIRPKTLGLMSCTIDNISITEVLDPEWDQTPLPGADSSIASGACRFLSTAQNVKISQSSTAYAASFGKFVEVSIDITEYVSNQLRVRFTGMSTYHSVPASVGTHTLIFANEGGQTFEVSRGLGGATDITFNNVIVRQVLAPTGWTDGSENPGRVQTDSTGHLELTNPNGLITEEAIAYQEVPVVIGIPYQVKADKSGGPSIIQIGTVSATGDYYQSPNTVADIDVVVVATTSSLFVTARNYNWSAAPALVDNASVTEVRSAPTLTFNETVNCTGAENDGGSDYVWIDTPAGDRNLFTVTSFLPTVSACTSVRTLESPTADVTGDSWAINGTRKTLNHDTTNRDPRDWGPGWTIEFASGTYPTSQMYVGFNHTNTTGWAVGDEPIIMRPTAGATTRPVIQLTYNSYLMLAPNGGKVDVRGLRFEAGTGAGTSTYFYGTYTNTVILLDDCAIVPHPTAGRALNVNYGTIIATNCYFKAGSNHGVDLTAAHGGAYLRDCIIDGASGTLASDAGILLEGFYSNNSVAGCVVKGCAGDGMAVQFTAGPSVLQLLNNTIVDNAGHGIATRGTANAYRTPITFYNNIIAYNGGYGVTDTVASSVVTWKGDNNAVYGNGNGSYNGKPVPGPRSITLTADPFTNHDAGDYTINNVTDGGSKLRSKSYPTPSDQDWPSTPEDG